MMGWNKRAERAETKAMFWEEEYHAQKAEIERLCADNHKLMLWNAEAQARCDELLDCMRSVLSSLEHLGMDAFGDAPFLIHAARAAIAKAEGK